MLHADLSQVYDISNGKKHLQFNEDIEKRIRKFKERTMALKFNVIEFCLQTACPDRYCTNASVGNSSCSYCNNSYQLPLNKRNWIMTMMLNLLHCELSDCCCMISWRLKRCTARLYFQWFAKWMRKKNVYSNGKILIYSYVYVHI